MVHHPILFPVQLTIIEILGKNDSTPYRLATADNYQPLTLVQISGRIPMLVRGYQ